MKRDIALVPIVVLSVALLLLGACSGIRAISKHDCQAKSNQMGVPAAYHWFYGCSLEIEGHWYFINQAEPAPIPDAVNLIQQ